MGRLTLAKAPDQPAVKRKHLGASKRLCFKLALALTLSLISASCTTPPANQSHIAPEPLPIQPSLLADHPLFSGSVIIIRDGSVIYEDHQGLTDKETGISNDTNTRYSIGSVGKLLTSIALAQMVEQNLLAWDTPVISVLPEFQSSIAESVTVDHLVRHISGLSGWGAVDEEQISALDNNQGYFELAIAQQVNSSGPADFAYRNTNFILLGEIIARGTGKSYEEAIFDLVLKPAGVTERAFMPLQDQDKETGLARPYIAVDYETWWNSEGPIKAESAASFTHIAPSTSPSAGGGARMSARDLATVLQRFQDGKYGSQASIALLCEPDQLGVDHKRRYARGCLARNTTQGILVGHNGSTAGVHARAFIRLDGEEVIAVLSNHDAQASPVLEAILTQLEAASNDTANTSL